jgi:hypothetical protein
MASIAAGSSSSMSRKLGESTRASSEPRLAIGSDVTFLQTALL